MPLEQRTSDLWVSVQETPLDVGAASGFLQSEQTGGINLFVGTTRRWTAGVETLRLEYEAFEPMALAEMEQIGRTALARWGAHRVCLLHRIGTVPAGEPSVVVGAATPHRAEAFACSRYLIDTLKQQVPIWKREVFSDGTKQWVEGSR